jgi:hypothetical protein
MREFYEFIFCWGLNASKPQRVSIGTADVYSIQEQHMKMDIEIERTAEALDQGHGAGLCHGLCKARFVCQMRGDGTEDNAQHPGHDFGVTGKQKTQWKRYTQYPLAHGLMRQYLVYKQGGTIRHPARTTTGAKSSFLTAKRHQFFIVAGFAPDPEKTMFKAQGER